MRCKITLFFPFLQIFPSQIQRLLVCHLSKKENTKYFQLKIKIKKQHGPVAFIAIFVRLNKSANHERPIYFRYQTYFFFF